MYTRFDETVGEKFYAAEKDAATIRIAVIALNSVVYVFLMSWEHVIPWLADGLLSLAWVYALVVYFVQPYRRFPILLSSYFTTVTDAVLITAWLHATGGVDSPFWVLWYVSIAAVAYRFNGRDTMAAAGLYSTSYVLLLAAEGQLSGHWADVTLRVGYVFLMGALCVLLSGEVSDQIRAKFESRKIAAQAAAAEAKFRGLLESAPDPIIIANGEGRIVIVNAEVERVFGYTRDEILNQPVEVLVPEALRSAHAASWNDYASHPERREMGAGTELRGRRKDGAEFPVEIRLSPTTIDEGLLVTAVIRDVTERKRVRAELEDSEERFRRLSEVTLEGVVIHESGFIIDVNRALADMFGYDETEMIGQPAIKFLAPESREAGLANLAAAPEGVRRYTGLRKDGSTFPVEVLARDYRLNGRSVRVTAARDITERLGAEEALRESEARFRALIENASDFIIIIDKSAAIRYVSPSVVRMLGYDEGELVGRSCFEFVHPEDVTELVEIFGRRLVERGVGVPIEFRTRRADGSWRILEATGNFDLIDAPELGGVILNARDITERRQAEEAVKRMAYHDSLTGLPNRALFADRLRIALAQTQRSNLMLGVVFLDIDHFKLVNDTLGHIGGDELLQRVGQELSLLVREGDTVARVGGDEFVLLLSGMEDPQDAIDIAGRILSKLDKRRVILGRELRITTSIGISVYPDHGEDADTLLANADIAMYQAKDRGRNAFQVYSPAMKQHVVERLALENDFRNALERDEFVTFFQPIVDIRNGEVIAAEALVRWQHPDRGPILPDAFIPVITDSDLIVALDEFVLRSSCAHAVAWRADGLGDLQVTVNLSARSLQRRDLVELVERLVDETGLPADSLALEITEGAVMANMEAAVESLRRLRELGVAVSVDDFGTGYSSLSYLKRFPIDSVKIDRSFIRDVTTDPNDAAIVSTIIAMGHSLNLRVIAEGVETEEQLAFLYDRGCDEFQGYLFAKPLPDADFRAVLNAPPSKRKAEVG